MRRIAACFLLCLAVPATAGAQSLPGTDVPSRETEPVVMTGEAFGDWAVPANVNAKLPGGDLEECTPGVDPSRIGDGLSAFSLPEDCPTTTTPSRTPRPAS